jgi:hypothetical protein
MKTNYPYQLSINLRQLSDNEFVSIFKKIMLGENTPKIFVEATKFLEKKGTIEKMENHSIIRIFCSKENPSFIPYYVPDKLFIT